MTCERPDISPEDRRRHEQAVLDYLFSKFLDEKLTIEKGVLLGVKKLNKRKRCSLTNAAQHMIAGKPYKLMPSTIDWMIKLHYIKRREKT